VPAFTVPPRDGEFRKNSHPAIQGSIGCVKEGTTWDEPGYAHCLRLGSLRLGMPFHFLQVTLIQDHQIPEAQVVSARMVGTTPDGTRRFLIPFQTQDEGDRQRLRSYLVTAVDASGAVELIQVTGTPSTLTEGLTFSSIGLGSREQWVIDILGLPSSATPVPQIKGTLWNYAPFPFSVELVDGAVYSIQIRRPSPEDLRQVFRPLLAVPE
jgi:hypothetical protein